LQQDTLIAFEECIYCWSMRQLHNIIPESPPMVQCCYTAIDISAVTFNVMVYFHIMHDSKWKANKMWYTKLPMYNNSSLELTNLSSSDDRPVKQVFFILLMATSLPLHFPWYTVPNVPEPSSLSSSRSSFLIICEEMFLSSIFQQHGSQINNQISKTLALSRHK
jgi:hypothetical protein